MITLLLIHQMGTLRAASYIILCAASHILLSLLIPSYIVFRNVYIFHVCHSLLILIKKIITNVYIFHICHSFLIGLRMCRQQIPAAGQSSYSIQDCYALNYSLSVGSFWGITSPVSGSTPLGASSGSASGSLSMV